MSSPLAKGIAQASAPTASPLARACASAGAIVHRPITIPIGEGVATLMRVLGPDEELAAVAEFGERVRAASITPDWLSTDVIEGERARAYLARACRDAADPSRPAGSPEEWRSDAITAPVIAWLWSQYADLVATFDPLGGAELLEADVLEIEAAIEKKNARSLAFCGVWKLSRYLLVTADRRASSPTPPFSTGTEPADS